ncbi:MAG: hypothetical protein AAGK23_07595 [Pseudomonadota bacterium]
MRQAFTLKNLALSFILAASASVSFAATTDLFPTESLLSHIRAWIELSSIEQIEFVRFTWPTFA